MILRHQPGPQEIAGRAAAFFDLDETLIGVNSALLYAEFERRHKRITPGQYARAVAWMALYRLSLVDMDRAFAQVVRLYAGKPEAYLVDLTREFFEAHVAHTVRPGAREALAEHRSLGHPLVILTASSTYLAKMVGEALDIEVSLANAFPTDARGVLTGSVVSPICYGPGKVVHARRWAEGANVSLAASYFYTDSYTDLPMLEAVGHPRVVHPDARLKAAARLRGWPVLDWRKG